MSSTNSPIPSSARTRGRMVTAELVERSAHLFGRGPAPCRGLCVAWLLARWFIIRWCPVSALMPVHMRWGRVGYPLQYLLRPTSARVPFPLFSRENAGDWSGTSVLAAGQAQPIAPAMFSAGATALHVGDRPGICPGRGMDAESISPELVAWKPPVGGEPNRGLDASSLGVDSPLSGSSSTVSPEVRRPGSQQKSIP